MSSELITFAIIGVGLIGPRHAQTVIKNSQAKLVAVVDLMPNGEQLAQELGAAYFKSVADMLQSSNNKPQAAIICTPNHTHVPLARELSSAGIHILIEKPFCTDIESGKDLVAHLDKLDAKALVAHHRRFNPYMMTAKETVGSGSLGNVIAVNGIWATYKPMEYFDPPREWRRENTGGVVLINLVHEIDLLHYLFGPITRVHAEKTISQRGFEAEEGAVLTLRFKSGAVGSFLFSDNVPSPHNFESGTGENPLIPKTGKDFYRIFGTDASLSVPDMTLSSYAEGQKSWHQELVQKNVPVSDGVPFELQLDHFIKVIRGEASPSCTPRDGLAALVVCQAVKEALKENKTVDIDTSDFDL
ncbi:quinate utilization oxidoreductase [Fusarium phyllophilum]|uniref:Quinate utilization oxidoreductase n=1 Tax=Fusarium phyllophilum TaxID=47803 RepID=A0A8H5K6X0_9HYPO|nr:quinate utilization oxidoreductase [Fusarium phyllophilum]